MIIRKLYLENFLSYKRQFAEFGDGLNVVVGKNAAGKTNLIDSVYFSALGKSVRGLKDKELINWDEGAKAARIRLLVDRKYSSHTVDILIDSGGKKRITVDGLPLNRLGDLIGIVNIVFFGPNEMGLVKDSPSDRRRFMDISLSQQNKLYLYSLMRYNKLLMQRNKLFKTRYSDPNLKSLVMLVTESMLESQAYIIQSRKEFLEKLSPVAYQKHTGLTGGAEKLELKYLTEKVDFDDIKASLLKLYEDSFVHDSKLEFTSVGVHRDDMQITVDDTDLRRFGSQGQQRTAVLSMKLAEIEMFKEKTQETPVLILDDVFSELDGDRREKLIKSVEGVQTLITCTDYESTMPARVFYIEDKSIKKVEERIDAERKD